MSKNKKKTAREKRILVGAFLTAVVIAAGSTFAWFTSTDTVTNRLSANADYDVKIVESFAPPENWLPGEKVDKDVYAVNTGSIEAFAKATVSGVMSMTREVPVPITDDIYVPTEYSYCTYSNGNNSWGDPSDGIPENYNNPNTVNAVAGKEYTVNGNIITTPDDAQKAYVTYEQDGTTVASVTFYKAEGKSDSAHSWDFTSGEIYDCVQLKPEEVYVIEAGAYLAYCPSTDAVNYNGGKFGNKAVAFKEPTGQTVTYYHNTGTTAEPVWEPCGEQEYNNHKNDNTFSDYYSKVEGGTPEGDPTNYGKTDFTPHADGLYVFRRSIVVNAENGQHVAGTETFEYEGYYFLGGKYYKIMNLKVTPDEGEDSIDVAADGITKDGQLKSATAYLVREEKVYDLKPDSFRYDAANNRIIASYATNTENGLVGSETNLTDLAAALDEAEHELRQAEVLLERAIEDSGIVAGSVKDKTKIVDDAQAAYNTALAAYDRAVAAYKQALENYNIGKDAFDTAKAEAETALKNLAGSGDTAKVTGTPATATEAETWTPSETDGGTLDVANGYTITAKGNQVTDTNKLNATEAYGRALKAYNDWKALYLTNNDKHTIYTYLVELAGKTDAGNKYEKTADHSAEGGINWTTNPAVADLTKEQLEGELEYAAKHITYQFANANVTFSDNDSHQYHQLLIALKIAENDYNNAVAAYNTAIGNLNKAISDLNSPVAAPDGSAFQPIDNTTEVTATYITTILNPWDSGDAKTLKDAYKDLTGKDAPATETDDIMKYTIKEVEDLPWTLDNGVNDGAEYALNEAYKALQEAEKDLASVENQTYIKQEDPDKGLPYAGPLYDADGNPTNIDNPQVKENLKAAWDNYYTKKNAADELERRLNAAQNGFEKDGDLLIYIYLTDNVTLTGDTAGKWQLLPTDINANKEAVFYYTSILAGGEVSSQLVDYVELDKSANQDMYKYFDFDLNITLDSVQVGFDENGSRNTQPVNEEWQSVSAAIKDPTLAPVSENNTTVVTWSQNGTPATQGKTGRWSDAGNVDIPLTSVTKTIQVDSGSGSLQDVPVIYSFEHQSKIYYVDASNDVYAPKDDGSGNYTKDGNKMTING